MNADLLTEKEKTHLIKLYKDYGIDFIEIEDYGNLVLKSDVDFEHFAEIHAIAQEIFLRLEFNYAIDIFEKDGKIEFSVRFFGEGIRVKNDSIDLDHWTDTI
ncbi:MAG: hypothetical protein Q4A00_06830 [Flavobacteriaceae bacterium]|nr:hypothetical protein [Flavobacteriaceae bacterium]